MAAFATATFTGSDSTAIESADSNWTKASGTTEPYVIYGNKAVNNNTFASPDYYYSGVTPPSADYKVEISLLRAMSETGNSAYPGVSARHDGSSTYYHARYSHSDQAIQLYKRVSGTYTQLGSNYSLSRWTVGTSVTVGVEVEGTTIRATLNGSAVITATDSDITSAGYAGIRGHCGQAYFGAYYRIDDFAAEEIAGGGAPTLSSPGVINVLSDRATPQVTLTF